MTPPTSNVLQYTGQAPRALKPTPETKAAQAPPAFLVVSGFEGFRVKEYRGLGCTY